MKRPIALMAAAFVLASTFSAPAFAQERVFRGAFAQAAAARANRATVTQGGAAHGAAIAQNGAGNDAAILQAGRNNSGTITQDGNNNSGCLIQWGDNLGAAMNQTGNNNRMGVVQMGGGVVQVPVEQCNERARNPIIRRIAGWQ